MVDENMINMKKKKKIHAWSDQSNVVPVFSSNLPIVLMRHIVEKIRQNIWMC